MRLLFEKKKILKMKIIKITWQKINIILDNVERNIKLVNKELNKVVDTCSFISY